MTSQLFPHPIINVAVINTLSLSIYLSMTSQLFPHPIINVAVINTGTCVF